MIRRASGHASPAPLLAALILAACSASTVRADVLVTYTFQTDSAIGSSPTSASFQVPLADVQAGEIQQFEITNIQFSFPGIDPLTFTTGSSIGLDNAAFVDPKSGATTFHDANQGLAVIAYHDMLFGNVFLSILFDNPGGDTFNAINGGPGSLGFGTGHWIATIPQTVPEPAGLALLALGLVGVAGQRQASRRRVGTGGAVAPFCPGPAGLLGWGPANRPIAIVGPVRCPSMSMPMPAPSRKRSTASRGGMG